MLWSIPSAFILGIITYYLSLPMINNSAVSLLIAMGTATIFLFGIILIPLFAKKESFEFHNLLETNKLEILTYEDGLSKYVGIENTNYHIRAFRNNLFNENASYKLILKGKSTSLVIVTEPTEPMFQTIEYVVKKRIKSPWLRKVYKRFFSTEDKNGWYESKIDIHYILQVASSEVMKNYSTKLETDDEEV